MITSTILDPVLNPLLPLGPFWVIVVMSLVVSLFTTIIYKYATDQNKLRKLKADLKRYQKKAQAAQKDSPEKAMKIQKDMMKLNGEYMKASFRSTLYTFIPVLIFFGWLAAHMSFAPIMADQPFDILVQLQPGVNGSFTLNVPSGVIVSNTTIQALNSSLLWTDLKASEGVQEFSVVHDASGEEHFFSVLISEYDYSNPVHKIDNSEVFQVVSIGLDKLYVFDGIFLFKDLPWVKNWGWLGAYILFSLIFTTGLRKAMKLA